MEIKYFLMWYLLLFGFGVIGLPISSMIFKSWQDKGYAFSKYVGLFMVGMVWWFYFLNSYTAFLADHRLSIVSIGICGSSVLAL